MLFYYGLDDLDQSMKEIHKKLENEIITLEEDIMSTRSIVAYPDKDGWKGVYCHYDGYPTHRGEQIWNMILKEGISPLDFRQKYILNHPNGWSSFGEICYCHNFERRERKDKRKLHTELDKNGRVQDTGGLEWGYIVGLSALTIMARVPTETVTTHRRLYACVYTGRKRYRTYKIRCQKLIPIMQVKWEEEEPNWGEVEKMGDLALDMEMQKLGITWDTW